MLHSRSDDRNLVHHKSQTLRSEIARIESIMPYLRSGHAEHLRRKQTCIRELSLLENEIHRSAEIIHIGTRRASTKRDRTDDA